jgi:peptidoglycan endopeptidase LytE
MNVNRLRKSVAVCSGLIFLIFFSASFAPAQTQAGNSEGSSAAPSSKKFLKAKSKKVALNSGKYKTHKIRKGETIAKIARTNGCSVDNLLKMNAGIDPRKLRPGSVVRVPVATVATAKHRKNEEFKENKNTVELVYRVKKGETLYSLSKKFKLSQDEIRNLNKLQDDTIIIGMPLMIKTLNTKEASNTEEEGYRLVESDEGEDIEGDEDKAQEEIEEAAKESGLKYTLRDGDVTRLLNYALDFLGTTYKYGGSNVSAIDCSAFVKTVFKEVNIPLPRTSREQIMLGIDVPRENLREGDLLFFAKRKRINHVAMYIGNDMYIHAARKSKGVIVSKIDNPYFKKTFVGAKRIFQLESEKTTETKPQSKDFSLAEKALIE